MTHRWLDRCIQRFNETEPKYGYNQALFPIVQGCVYPDLRKQSAEFIASKGADGNAIGGLAVGEPVDKMYEMIEIVNEILPKDKPRYLMGVGTPVNILEGIERGVDMFDCVMPTRNGRNGMLFTKDGIINMRNKKWETDFSPIEADGASSCRYVVQQGLFAPSFPCARATGHANCLYTQPGILSVAGRRSKKAYYCRRFLDLEADDGQKSIN